MINHFEDCAFELSYIKKEHEISNGEIIAMKRVRLGEMLAKIHPVDADYVVPIPETAIHYAQGYSHQANIPLCLAIFKNRPKVKTLFIDNREQVIQDVFTVLPHFIENKKIVLVDETVISGLSLETIMRKIKKFNPKEIHLRLGCPPMIRKCPSSNFGKDWSYDGSKLFEDRLFNSVEYLSINEIKMFAKCSYCFGSDDDKSKLVGY